MTDSTMRSVNVPSLPDDMPVNITVAAAIEELQAVLAGGWTPDTEAALVLAIETLTSQSLRDPEDGLVPISDDGKYVFIDGLGDVPLLYPPKLDATDAPQPDAKEGLAPCPFCGQAPKLNDFVASGSASYVEISCVHPVEEGPDGFDAGSIAAEVRADTAELAVAAWNRRSAALSQSQPAPQPDAPSEQALYDLLYPYVGDDGQTRILAEELRGFFGSPQPDAKASGVEGWVLVPREPTSEQETVGAQIQGGYDPVDLKAVYRAMIAAAPTPPTEAGAKQWHPGTAMKGSDPLSIAADDKGHRTRFSDSSFYDEVCVLCGATDARDDKRLDHPCPEARDD